MRILAALALLLSIPGCLGGILYTSHTLPLVRNMDATPIGSKVGVFELNELREPVTQVNMRLQWASNAVGDAARAAGIDKIYYADLHTLSILFGIYKRTTIMVSGDPPPETTRMIKEKNKP